MRPRNDFEDIFVENRGKTNEDCRRGPIYLDFNFKKKTKKVGPGEDPYTICVNVP